MAQQTSHTQTSPDKKQEKRRKEGEPKAAAPGHGELALRQERATWLGCWCDQDGLEQCQCVQVSSLEGNADIKAYASLRGLETVEACHAWMAGMGGKDLLLNPRALVCCAAHLGPRRARGITPEIRCRCWPPTRPHITHTQI